MEVKTNVSNIVFRDGTVQEVREWSDSALSQGAMVFLWEDEQLIIPLDLVKSCTSTLE